MKLEYLEYLDLSDALVSAIHSARRFANTAVDEVERNNWEEKEKRYQELQWKLKQYAADNLY